MVLDAIRLEKKKMAELMKEEKLVEYMEKYALFSIALD